MYDIVGALPPELLIYVVQYLDLKDIIRSQRVRPIAQFNDGNAISTLF